jgi:ABC-type molybdate transport system ATPase subunit
LIPFIAGLPNKFSVPIIYVTHVAEEVIALAETIVLIDSGHLVAKGGREEITKSVEFCGVVGFETKGLQGQRGEKQLYPPSDVSTQTLGLTRQSSSSI